MALRRQTDSAKSASKNDKKTNKIILVLVLVVIVVFGVYYYIVNRTQPVLRTQRQKAIQEQSDGLEELRKERGIVPYRPSQSELREALSQ